jgi:uncharacterized protein with von Willebrand factor type A (vWA) domain
MPDLDWITGLATAPGSDEERLFRLLTGFAGAVRHEGVTVGPDRALAFCRAAALVSPEDLYWAGRSTLVCRHEDIDVYDRIFRVWFAGRRPTEVMTAPEIVARAGSSAAALEGAGRAREAEPGSVTASRIELLRNKSFEELTEAELAELGRLIARVSLSVPLRRTRRSRPARRGDFDIRFTLRRTFRTGGEPIERHWRTRRETKRRLILLLDVSGSMTPYSRGLMMFAHAALRAHPGWEAFCFGTRLTRVTRALATARPDEALARAADEVFDWDGGTRIGESLKAFIDRFGHGGMARGSVVVICSDGLDTGDAELVGAQMQRLKRLTHRIVWVNPLKATPGYAPLAGGMRHALPHVDTFASGHSLASLEALAHELDPSAGRRSRPRAAAIAATG